VDASVALKWFLQAPDSETALRWRHASEAMIVPDLLFAECMNAVWLQVRRNGLAPEKAEGIMKDICGAPWQTVPSRTLAAVALTLAVETGQTGYDCVYLALARTWKCQLVTADRTFHTALAKGKYASTLLWYADEPPATSGRD
jgi:predicted nucleic acid-binding protein